MLASVRRNSGSNRSLADAPAGLWHGDPAHKYLMGIYACRRGLPAGLRHGTPVHRYARAISPWRRGLLAGLWHSDPTHRYFRGIYAWRDCLEPVSNRSLADAPAGLWHGDPAHRYLSAILAWRTGNLSTLLPDLRPCSWPLRLGCVLGHDSGLNPGH